MTARTTPVKRLLHDSHSGWAVRLLSPLARPWRAWSRWWFEPASTVPIGLFRICYGAIVLLCVALLVPDIQVFFGRGGPFTQEDAARFWGNVPDYSVLLWYPAPGAVAAFFAVFTLAALCLTIGLWTRISAIVVFVGLVSIGHRNPLILHGGDTLLRIMAFYLILAPAGAVLSVDRLIGLMRGTAPAQPPLAPPWAQRLLQLQVAFVYAMTVLLKLKGGAWVDGTALYYTSRLEEFHRFPMPFVADSMLLVNLLTYWTLATELSLAFLIWVPGLRKFVLVNGVLLHLGIEYSMNVPLFAFTMIVSYITFVDVESAWQWVLAQQPLRRLPRATLWIPAGCRSCAATARVLLALDLFHRLEPALEPAPDGRAGRRDAAAAHLSVETADGRDLTGFAACRWLAARLPLLWPLAPVFALPGARRLSACADRRHQSGAVTHSADPFVAANGRSAPLPAASALAGSGPCNGVAAFLSAHCLVSRSAMTSAEALFDAYSGWARKNGERQISQQEFGQALTEQGLTRRRHGKANRWHWAGVRLVTAADRQPSSPTEANRSEREHLRPVLSSDATEQAPLVGSPGFAVAQQAGG
jgi:hypothetical protein